MRKLTKSYVANQISKLSHGKCKLIDPRPYKKAHQKLEIWDKVTHQSFSKAWYSFKERPRSPYWYKELNIGRHRKWTKKTVAKYIRNHSAHHQYQLKLKGKFPGTKKKIPILHRKPYGCGKIFHMTFDKFKNAGERCPYCRYKKIRLSRKEMAKRTYLNTNKQYILITKRQPRNADVKLTFKHLKCGTLFHDTWNTFWEIKDGKCPHCSTSPHKKLSFKVIDKRISKATNGMYKLDFDIIKKYHLHYMGNRTKNIPIFHKKCGNYYFTTWDTFTDGSRCPYCSASHGEQTIILWCQKHHLQYIHGYLTTCYMSQTSKKLHKPLHIDVYLPQYRIGIEFNGIQHIMPTQFFGKEKAYHRQVNRDSKKKLWCAKHNIVLVPINTLSTNWTKHDHRATINTLNYLVKPIIISKRSSHHDK